MKHRFQAAWLYDSRNGIPLVIIVKYQRPSGRLIMQKAPLKKRDSLFVKNAVRLEMLSFCHLTDEVEA